MRRRAQLTAVLITSSILLGACGGAGAGSGGTTAVSVDVPARIDDDDFGELARIYVGLAFDDPTRRRLGARLIEYLDRQTAGIIERGDYDAAAAHLGRMTDLLAPEDFRAERLPRALERIARFVLERGSPRGDEGRVLSALLVLETLHEEQDWDARYREVSEWGRSARASLPSAIERFSRLIDVWEEHERLTPAPEVLAFLARLHIERREAILQLVPRDGPAMGRLGLSQEDLRAAPVLLRRAPLDVAGVFLRHGDPATALTYVESMGDAGGIEMHLIRILRDARDGEDEALVELAQAYLDGRPDVARGLCRMGRRESPSDARYPLCLARSSAAEGDFPQATGWFAEAIRLGPEDREVYDEALDSVGEFIAAGVFDAEASGARDMARAAERILAERQRRWPGSEPSVAPERLHYVVGLLEMNAGNSERARERFEASVAARETAEAHLELGRLAERTGRARDAARHYRRALDLTPGDGPLGSLARAEILEHLGDALRAAGDSAQAERMYRQALGLWDGAQEGERMSAEAQLRRGVILDRLGRGEESATAFRRAMELGPGEREIYARVLSHLVVTTPNLPLAEDVFARALRQLNLAPEWRVYFALWVAAIAARAGEATSQDVQAVLRSQSGDAAWFGRLARFGTGQLPYGELLTEATNVGQRTEAHFYEAARLLSAGDAEHAQELFRRVLDSQMVNFYEYIMARELVAP